MSITLQKTFSLDECKIQASILLKQLHLQNPQQLITLNRFRLLPIFATENALTIIKNVKRKHALAIIAIEYGFNSWSNLKTYFDKTILTTFIMHSGFLNQWFASYKEARAYLASNSTTSFLLPYKHQFFVCEANCIESFGLNPNDPNWQLIGYNWIEPSNIAAWEQLNKAYLQKHKT